MLLKIRIQQLNFFYSNLLGTMLMKLIDLIESEQ